MNEKQKAEIRSLHQMRSELLAQGDTPDFVFDDIDEAIDRLLDGKPMFDFAIVPLDAAGKPEIVPKELEWLTVSEASSLLRVSQQAVRNLITDGKLKAADVGSGAIRKTWIIRRSDIDALSQEHRQSHIQPRQKPASDDGRWGL